MRDDLVAVRIFVHQRAAEFFDGPDLLWGVVHPEANAVLLGLLLLNSLRPVSRTLVEPRAPVLVAHAGVDDLNADGEAVAPLSAVPRTLTGVIGLLIERNHLRYGPVALDNKMCRNLALLVLEPRDAVSFGQMSRGIVKNDHLWVDAACRIAPRQFERMADKSMIVDLHGAPLGLDHFVADNGAWHLVNVGLRHATVEIKCSSDTCECGVCVGVYSTCVDTDGR